MLRFLSTLRFPTPRRPPSDPFGGRRPHRPDLLSPTPPQDLHFIVYDRAREQGRIHWYGERMVIGRRADADIRVNEPTMSGMHAEIVPSEEGLRIRDLDSLNGTQLNGVRIVESLLQPGDQIQIGRARIVLATAGEEPEVRSKDGRDSVFGDPVFGAAVSGDPVSGDPVSGDFGAGSQTVKIRLDHLRESGAEVIEEDRRILLLRDLFEGLKSADDAEAVLEKTRSVLSEAFHRARVYVLTADGDGSWRDRGRDGSDERPPSLTFVEETVHSESAILSSSLLDDERFSASESARISGIETAMAAPTGRDGKTVAVIYVDRLGLPPFTVQDLHLLGIAANHVSAVLENVARIEALQRANQKLMETQENLAELNRNLERIVEERTAEVRRQKDEIERLAESKDELLGIAAHDIRGPLTVIQGTTELLRLRNDDLDEETLSQSLDLMHNAAAGLSRLLSELLDAKAIESGKIRLDRRRVEIGSMLESSLAVPRLAAGDKEIELEIDVDDGLEAHADPRRLGQAVTNLLLNAVKFSDRGGRIVLRGRDGDDGGVRIEVQDFGPGIAEEDIDRIFGTFEQGEAGRQFGGSGLGLMIAKRLVDLHDGELEVESELGEGSCFAITLPAPEAARS